MTSEENAYFIAKNYFDVHGRVEVERDGEFWFASVSGSSTELLIGPDGEYLAYSPGRQSRSSAKGAYENGARS